MSQMVEKLRIVEKNLDSSIKEESAPLFKNMDDIFVILSKAAVWQYIAFEDLLEIYRQIFTLLAKVSEITTGRNLFELELNALNQKEEINHENNNAGHSLN